MEELYEGCNVLIREKRDKKINEYEVIEQFGNVLRVKNSEYQEEVFFIDELDLILLKKDNNNEPEESRYLGTVERDGTIREEEE